MYHYGQDITYGPLSAPQLFTGHIVRWSMRDTETDEDLTDASDDIAALAFHSRQAEINFETQITSGSDDMLDLSTGVAIAVSGISTGMVLAAELTERWALMQRKTATCRATWFPDMPASEGGTAGTDLSGFTPDQAELGIVLPGGGLIYSTYGLTHESGVVHELAITQRWLITPDDPSPDGKLLGAAASRYKRTLSLLLLAKAAPPAVRSVLEIGGAPAHAQNYRITSVEPVLERMKGKMYQIAASWIPPFGDSEGDGGGGGGGGGGGEE